MAIPKKVLFGGIGVVVLIPTLIFLFLYYGSYSEGSRAGTVMKLSKKGYVFKTYEGELNTGTQSPPWQFSVDSGNEAVLNALDAAAQSGERVKLMYEEKFVQFDWRGDTKYFVVSVERIQKP